MSSRFLATASTSFDVERTNHVPNISLSRGPRVCPLGADNDDANISVESPILRDSPFEANQREQGAGGDVSKTNIQFYKFVRRYTKSNKIPFQRGPKLDVAISDCLKSWCKVESLTKQQKNFVENFAKKVPYWYKSAKSDDRLFRQHAGM